MRPVMTWMVGKRKELNGGCGLEIASDFQLNLIREKEKNALVGKNNKNDI